MSNLKLITTEKFGNIDCNFYRNMNNDILLTREQIGSALEYSNPQKAIDNIHAKHKDRLDGLSITLKTRGVTGQEYPTTFYSQRGIMEICRWSRQSKANEFMDWTWTIIEKYRDGELNQPDMQPLLNALTTLTTTITTMQQDISELKHKQDQTQQLPKKSFSRWTSKMFPKYQLLMDYFDINRKELYHNLYIELQNTYPDIDLRQEQDDYCFENGLDSCFTLDVVEHNKTLRKLFETVVDNLLDKYNLTSEIDIRTRPKTIFNN